MSWQNFVLSLALRYRVKRGATGEPEVAKTRELARQTAMKMPIPAGWRVRPVAAPLPGEWIERDGGGDPGTRDARCSFSMVGDISSARRKPIAASP
jgi:hypothetical protein